jgi:hypothetical protein
MSLSTFAEEFDSASHNSRPALGRGLRIKKKRCVKKKRCMLTDSLRTHFNQDMSTRTCMTQESWSWTTMSVMATS